MDATFYILKIALTGCMYKAKHQKNQATTKALAEKTSEIESRWPVGLS